MIGSCNNYSINKTNFAIEVSNNLTILQRKFFNHILFEQEAQGWNTPIIQLQYKDINALIGSNIHRQNHNKIKSIFKQLLTKELIIVNGKYLGYAATCYISYVKIHEKYIEISIHDELKKYLNINYMNEQGIKNTLKGYTSLDLAIVNKLHSTYHIALYEFLSKTWNEQKKKNNISIDLNLLRSISTNKQSYNQYKEFHRSILKPAVDAINNYTDLKIEYIESKYAGKVENIVFNIKRNANFKDKNNILVSNPIVLENNLNMSVSEPIKTISKITQTQIYEILPEPVENAKNWGYADIEKLMQMYNSTEDKKYQILAILTQISMEYSEKSNQEKCKILSALIKKNVHANALAIHNAKNAEIIQKKEQQKLEAMNTIHELERQAQRQKIRENAYNEFQQELSKQESMVAKIWHKLEALLDIELPNQQQKNTWFKPAIAKLENNILHIILPNRFKLDYFRNSLLRYVEKTLFNLNLNFIIKVSV